MTNRNTKRALLSSVMALFLCFAMLLGTTFAWFTDSVESGTNSIVAGNLDVELKYATVENGTITGWSEVKDQVLFDPNALWEPGRVEVVYLEVSNLGKLALKYQLGVNITNKAIGKSVLGNDIDLTNYLNFKVVPLTEKPTVAYTREEAVAALGETRGFSDYNGVTTALEVGGTDYVALVVYMPTTVGNEANYDKNYPIVPSIEFGVKLYATQQGAEFDSFGPDYDDGANHENFKVTTGLDLQNAVNEANPGDTIELENDIVLTEPIVIPAPAASTYSLRRNANAVVIDLNGKTITAGKDGYVIENGNGATVVLKDSANGGEIKGVVYNANGSVMTINGGTYTAVSSYAILNDAATLTINSGTINGTAATYPIYSYNDGQKLTINDVTINGVFGALNAYGTGTVEINGGTYNMTGVAGKSSHIAYFSTTATVVINGGSFNHVGDISMSATGGGGVCLNGSANVTINGGSFNGDYADIYSWSSNATLTIKGGTFAHNPGKVAAGYQVTNNGDGTYTVGAYKISTGAELVDAIANGKAVELTQDVNLGKIDLTGAITNDVVINANGHKITTTDAYGIEVTPGKNVTISNANVEMTKAGNYITYAAGFKIANGDYAGATITLENCTITMANTDWAYAVTMPASVKNLNLVINNCTLEGAVAVQCWGDNNTITITNSKLICNYTTNAMYTSYCVALQGDGTYNSENNTLVIDNCEFLYSGIDNFNSSIYAAKDVCKGNTGNTVTVTNCTYGEKVVLN